MKDGITPPAGEAASDGTAAKPPIGKKPGTRSVSRKRGQPTRSAKGQSPERLRGRILQAAVTEFAEHSFSGARIDSISKRAKTVDRMIYYYFGNKDSLYQSVMEKVYGDLVAAQQSFEVDEADPVAAIRELILHTWRHYLDHSEFVRLVATENLLRARFVKKARNVRNTLLPLIERTRHLLETGQRTGVFRADADPERMLMSMMSLGFFYVSNQYTCSRWLGVDLMEKGRIEAWGEHICAMVLGYLNSADESASRA